MRLERELDGLKVLRVERRSALGVPGAGSDAGEARSRRGSSIGLLMGEMGEVAGSDRGKLSDSIRSRSNLRRVSGQKGFL